MCLAILASATAKAEVRVTDDLGREVRLDKPARRIVALYGALSDMLAAMDSTDLLAARTKADTSPPAVAALPSIGTHMRPNLELVLGLKPDLVLQMSGRKQAREALAELETRGIPTAFFNPATFDQLFSVIDRLGALTGRRDRAQALNDSMRSRLAAVAKAVDPVKPRPTVFFEVRYPNLLAAGQGSMVSDVVARAGGRNPVRDERKLVRLSEEELIRLNPDYYLVQKGPMNPAPVPPAHRAHYRTLAAVPDRVFTVDERMFSRPGPGNVEAVETLARILHPEGME